MCACDIVVLFEFVGVVNRDEIVSPLNIPLYLGTIMTFDTDSCENNTVEEGKVEQSIDLPWSIPKDYDANNETRLLRYGNAAEEGGID
ncbi:hypothetical protein FQA39_LY08653 [Lamprigera yunnana]|nr:hypothetical protein FQA39_LY08653 [Lamprigera yunnana]